MKILVRGVLIKNNESASEEFPREIKSVKCEKCGKPIEKVSVSIVIVPGRFSVSKTGEPLNCCEDPSWTVKFKDSDVVLEGV